MKVKGGYKIQNTDTKKYYSLKPLTMEMAKKQLLALIIHTGH